MNITEEEKSIAQRNLDKCRAKEKDKNLIPVLVAPNTWVMMPKNATTAQLEVKKRKYNQKPK